MTRVFTSLLGNFRTSMFDCASRPADFGSSVLQESEKSTNLPPMHSVSKTASKQVESKPRIGLFVTTIPVYYLWKSGSRHLDKADNGDSIAPHRSLIDLDVHLASPSFDSKREVTLLAWVLRREGTLRRAK